MRFLYPADPLRPRAFDPLFADEARLAAARGLQVARFDLLAFDRGELRVEPALRAGEEVVVRTFMLRAEEYARLASEVAARGARVRVSEHAYLAAHHLPRWLPTLEAWTPETVVLEGPVDAERLRAAWPRWAWSADVFVKDFVKSSTTSRGSIAHTVEEAIALAHAIAAQRGGLEGGLCLRRVEELRPETEERVFVTHGRAHLRDEVPDPTRAAMRACVDAFAAHIGSPFFTVDLCLRRDGHVRVVELGDGQVSDRKAWSVDAMVRVLEALSARS